MEIVEVGEQGNFVINEDEGEIYNLKEPSFNLYMAVNGKCLGFSMVKTISWVGSVLTADVSGSSLGGNGEIIFRTGMIDKITLGFGKVTIHFKEA